MMRALIWSETLANFILALDSDPARRAAFVQQASKFPAPLAGLKTIEHELGDLSIAWHLGPHAPWSQHITSASLTALVGHAIDDSGKWLDAQQLNTRVSTEPDDKPSAALDGYHLAVDYQPARRLIVEADLLGFFPIYYWNQDGVLLVGSSCEWFAAHPAFRFQADLQGLVGMLMINGLVANQTVLAGVRRLAPGHRLIGARTSPNDGYAAHQQLQYRMASSDRFAGASLPELVEIADAAMRRAIERHTPPGTATTQLVSGGLDSRLVSGYIKDSGIRCTGICLGQTYDFEARAAKSVAEVLAFPFELIRQEMEPAEFVECAKHRARQLQLSAGIGCGELLDAKGALEATAPCFWSGISLDDLLGGGAHGYGYDPDNAKWSFEAYEQKAFRWGLTPAQVAPLVAASDGPEIVAAVRRAFRRDFQACDDAAYRLVYRARLQNRHRYHLGNTVWQLSFASWPLLFVADRQWLETMFDLPPAQSMYKGVELELLRSKYPQLLSVPLDVNSWHYGWVNPSRLHRLRKRLNKIVPIERCWNDWYWRRWRGIERRRYWRFYDFDGPKWQAVRQYAEPLRERLNAWFNSKEVARLVPPPQEKLPKNNAFGDAAARRNLLGAAIWSAVYF